MKPDAGTTTPDAGTMAPDAGTMAPDAGSGIGVGSVGKGDKPDAGSDEVTGTGSSDEGPDDLDGNSNGNTKVSGGGCSAVDSGSTSAGTFAPILLGLAAIGSRRRKRSKR
jgi:MYXO-CTERM domain-containing protein